MAADFKIVASLDIPKSASKINADIPVLEKKLNSIRVLAELDTTRSINSIQSQLNTIAKQVKAPTIKVGIDTSGLKNAINNAKSQVSNKNQNTKVQIFDSKQLDAEGRKYFTKATNIIDQVKNYYTRNGALSVDISSIEKSNGQIKSFTASVEESTGVIKRFNFERGKIDTGGAKPNYGFVQTDSLKSIDRNAGANLKSTLNFLTRIDEKIMSIQSKSTKQANPLKEGTVYYDNYNKKLSETVAKIEEIKSANKTLSIEQKNEIKKMVTELQLYAKEQQKLAYPPMISSTSIEDSVKKAQATLTTLEQKWKNQGILTGEFKTQVANLRAELEKVGNTEGLNKYNTSLKVVQESAKQLLSNQRTLDNQMKSAQGAEKLAQKIAVLTARIEAYRKANSRSEKKFGSQYNDMLSALKNPNIDENAYNRIAKQFQVIRQEVNATNVAGKNFLQTFKEKLGKFTGWMSMTYAVSLVTRTIRSMVTDVVELDTALIDLKKTFKGTNEDLKEFYRSSNDIAKQLGVTTKEVITQASAWSRLGYNTKSQIESLSQTSSIFAAISPEMDVDAATNTLVSVLKAYEKYGLKAEDALDGIASKVNAVGNNFAVSNSDIAEALQRSSASMASANTDLEHTIALITAGKFRCLYVQKCA